MAGHFPNQFSGLLDESSENGVLVVQSPEAIPLTSHPLQHGLRSPVSRLSVSWCRGSLLRVILLRSPDIADAGAGGKAVEIKPWNTEHDNITEEEKESNWRRIAYGSVSPFALLQNRKNSLASLSTMPSTKPSPYHLDWWEYVMEYSKDIGSLLSDNTSSPSSFIEGPTEIFMDCKPPSNLKAAWELLEMFYVDKLAQPYIPERLVDWLQNYNCLFSESIATVHMKLVDFQKRLVFLQVVEDDPRFWDALSSALAVGWFDVVVKMLRLHGSYNLDQLGSREVENGLVEAVVVLISRMPRMRSSLENGKLGECFRAKADFVKAWEKWRGQITKLESSAFWVQCNHNHTREGLKTMIQVLLGNVAVLSNFTCHWVELYVSQLLYVRPLTVGLESMYNLAFKCLELKPGSNLHKLMGLLCAILNETIGVVLAECSRGFGSWMAAHAIELLALVNEESDLFLHEEHVRLGGINILELHRLSYAQVLASHVLTWQIAPIYLASFAKHGMGLLEGLFYRQPCYNHRLLLKSLEICRLYNLERTGASIMKMVGVNEWKHGRKGSGLYWLQQAHDEMRLRRIARQLFDSVGKSLSEESFKQWEGLVELISLDSGSYGGLEFLHKYKDFKKSLRMIQGGKDTDAARNAAESLVSLMRNPSTPQRFWHPLLSDSLRLLNWKEKPVLKASETHLLLNKVQELCIARTRPDFIEDGVPPQSLISVRLALATNLGRAIFDD